MMLTQVTYWMLCGQERGESNSAQVKSRAIEELVRGRENRRVLQTAGSVPAVVQMQGDPLGLGNSN